MASSNEHEGHRARLRKRFINSGLDGFEDHEALELYLYYAVKRMNTNPLAHRLIKEFGSLSALCNAPIDTLMSRGKISESTAVLLKLLPEMSRLYLNDSNNNVKKVLTREMLPDYLLYKFVGKQQIENCFLILTDVKGKELFSGFISEGSFTESVVPVRKMVDLAMRYNASGVILAHNHPSGIASPSKDDLASTQKFTQLLKNIDVVLLDHYIIADDECLSMYETLGDIIFDPNATLE